MFDTILVGVIVAIAIIIVGLGTVLISRSKESTPTSRTVEKLGRKTALALNGHPLDPFHVDSKRLSTLFGQTLEFIPPITATRTTKSALNGGGGIGSGPLTLEAGGSREEELQEDLDVAETNTGTIIQLLEGYLDSRHAIRRVDLTGNGPFRRFFDRVTEESKAIGLEIPSSVNDALMKAWEEQRAGINLDRFSDGGDPDAFVSVRAQFLVSSAPQNGQFELQVTSPSVNNGVSTHVRVRASGELARSAEQNLILGEQVRATVVGKITLPDYDSRTVNISAIYCYW